MTMNQSGRAAEGADQIGRFVAEHSGTLNVLPNPAPTQHTQNPKSTGLPVYRERRSDRDRTIVVTRTAGPRVIGIDQDGKAIRMSRYTLSRSWSQVGRLDLRATDIVRTGPVSASDPTAAQFLNPPCEIHEVVLPNGDDQDLYVSILLIPCFLSRAEGYFALLKDPHTRQWREFDPDCRKSKGAFVAGIREIMRREHAEQVGAMNRRARHR